ncbi:helix-turn-helix domain-containing protein [Agromyces sp. NPDC058104]|uniref:helix-turn-helix domain-containing protein n=1 Tax=Agromyces sp. NPDC058104 TaxID=3346342 RepID=UPI0036DF8283
MGFQSTTQAFAVQGVSGPQKAVLVALAHCRNEKTGLCCPSQETLAEMTSLGFATVRNALTALEKDHGLISRTKRMSGRYRIADAYELQLDSIDQCSERAVVGASSAESEQRSERTPTTARSEQAIETTSLRTGKKNKNYTSEFEEFWSVYPRHEGKADAFTAYQAAVKSTPADEILAGAQKYKLASLGGDPQYVKLAAGWLRGRRWEDEPIPAKSNPDWWLKLDRAGSKPRVGGPSGMSVKEFQRLGKHRQTPEQRARATLALDVDRPPRDGECNHREHPSSPGFCAICGDQMGGAA